MNMNHPKPGDKLPNGDTVMAVKTKGNEGIVLASSPYPYRPSIIQHVTWSYKLTDKLELAYGRYFDARTEQGRAGPKPWPTSTSDKVR